ncbi:MAG: hypothetical protein ABW019_02865 [Chitinophagaceae bacterium]
MKVLLLLSTVSFFALSANKCDSSKKETTPAATATYKAKLETKALCMNYTLRLMEGSMDTSMITPAWTDETTGKSYKNVFGLGNPCDFPSGIQQGDEFYFAIDTTSHKDECAVCMAYYPTPPKKLIIKVIEK